MNLQEILSSRNIVKVIYVDDELNKGSFYDNASAKIRQLIEEEYTNENYPFFNNRDIWEEEFNKWWGKASFDDVIKLSESIDFSRTITNIANKLSGILPNTCSLELLAPEQFDETYKHNLIEELANTKECVIILVDFELDGYNEDGDRLISSIASHESVFCGIFSQTFDVSDEINQWQMRNFNPGIYPISKKRFDDQIDTELTIQGLKNVIWLKQIESIKAMAVKLAATASETMKSGLKMMDPATFDRLIIANSMEEGCWEFEYLSRIMQVYFSRGIKVEMKRVFDDFQKQTNSLRDFHDGTKSECVNKDLLGTLQKEECYDDIEYINRIYSAISNGDIFLINENHFILLAQPCNLAIREDGRRSYDLDQAFLVPIYGSEKQVGTFCEKLQYPFNGELFHVSFVNRQRVSLSMLDLVSYNQNGYAYIDLTVKSNELPAHEIMQNNLLKRYDKIKNKISSIQQIYHLALNGRDDNDTICRLTKYFCKPFEMGERQVAVKPIVDGSKLTFNVKRVGRYSSYGAHVLLQQFMSYMSRPEFPAKFDRC